MKTKIMRTYRRAASATLSDFCHFAEKNYDCVEVTEWSNGEGYDVHISRKRDEGDLTVSLTRGELNAIKKLVKEVESIKYSSPEKKLVKEVESIKYSSPEKKLIEEVESIKYSSPEKKGA